VAKLVLIADDRENDASAIKETLAKEGIKNPSIIVCEAAEAIASCGGNQHPLTAFGHFELEIWKRLASARASA
jgi:hypothetical protein